MPSKNSRATAGPWGRLRPVEQDPLESMGLPSKGDTRLLNRKNQERYYTKIVERYMTFCSDAGKPDELRRRFSAMRLEGSSESQGSRESGLSSSSQTQTAPKQALEDPANTKALEDPANTKALEDVMMALRKLREGIVASKRADDFAIQAYLFNIRLSVLIKHHESYHPAILYLVRCIHPLHPLTSVELQEVVGYLVLDTACRRRDMAEAYALRRQYNLNDAKVDGALRALAHDNYILFRRVKRDVDGHCARVMDYAEAEMRMHALKCFGRTYFSVDLEFLRKVTDSTWDELAQRDGVGWELEDEAKVIIRRVKAK